jgi:hypothetical protein
MVSVSDEELELEAPLDYRLVIEELRQVLTELKDRCLHGPPTMKPTHYCLIWTEGEWKTIEGMSSPTRCDGLPRCTSGTIHIKGAWPPRFVFVHVKLILKLFPKWTCEYDDGVSAHTTAPLEQEITSSDLVQHISALLKLYLHFCHKKPCGWSKHPKIEKVPPSSNVSWIVTKAVNAVIADLNLAARPREAQDEPTDIW